MKYLPRLLVLGAALALLAVGPPGLAAPDPPDEQPETSSGGFIRRADGSTIEVPGAAPPSEPEADAPAEPADVELARRVFELTNDARRRHGRPALELDDGLAELARAHSADMLRRGYLSHVNLQGQSPSDRVAAGHRRLVGQVSENVWTGSGIAEEETEPVARRIVDSWMSSPGHRGNILREESTHLGVGVAREGGEIRATQDFATAWAWLDPPLPQRVSRKAFPELRLTTLGAREPANRFDVVWPASGKPAMDPVPLATTRLDLAPGTYRLRFYFPKRAGAAEFWIVEGPELVLE